MGVNEETEMSSDSDDERLGSGDLNKTTNRISCIFSIFAFIGVNKWIVYV